MYFGLDYTHPLILTAMPMGFEAKFIWARCPSGCPAAASNRPLQ